jgi:asparagine synthase (glutamine-hydrolysing)
MMLALAGPGSSFSKDCRERGWIDADAASRILTRYLKEGDDTKAGWRVSQSLWMLFVLESWAPRHGRKF